MPSFLVNPSSEQPACILYSRKEVAKIIGVSPKTLAQWPTTRPGYLRFCKIGNRVKYRHEDIVQLIERHLG